MAESMVRFGYLKYTQISKAISNGYLEQWSVVFTSDTHNIFLIDDELNPIEIRSRIPIFNSISEARNFINDNKSIQTGELISIKEGDLYKAYVVTILDNEIDITPVHKQQDFNYDSLQNTPITNKIGTTVSPIVLKDLPDGIYKITGKFITPDNITITSIIGNIVIKDSNEITKINNASITKYQIGTEIKKEEYITDEYLTEHGYMTESAIDTKLAALNIITQDNIETYVQNVFDTMITTKVSNEISQRIASQEEIQGLF